MKMKKEKIRFKPLAAVVFVVILAGGDAGFCINQCKSGTAYLAGYL